MKIDIRTLRKTKGFGRKMEERVITQYKLDNNIQDQPLFVGDRNIELGVYNENAIDILKNIPDNSIDMVFTDPPYPTTKRGGTGNSGGMCKTKEFSSGKVFEFNDIKPNDYIPQLYRVLKDGSHCYIMTNHVNLFEMLDVAQNVGFHFIKSLIWNKGNKIMGQAYMSQFEYVLFFRKGKFKKINDCGTSDILNIPNIKTKDSNGTNLHNTEKPIELTNILISNSSNVGDVVLDPFMGIGGAGVSAKQLEREFIGVEIDERYFNIAKERMVKAK